MNLTFLAPNIHLYNSLVHIFKYVPDVVITDKDFKSFSTNNSYDVLITPGNSFGIMDGGFDFIVENAFSCEDRVRQIILESFHGLLPIGQAISVDLNENQFLIYTPTMEIPRDISNKVTNIYYSMRAALLKIKELENRLTRTLRVISPGLGTGVGNVDPLIAAIQIRLAYNHIIFRPTTNGWLDSRLLISDIESTC